MLCFADELKQIILRLFLIVIVGVSSFEFVKTIERGCFSLIDIKELLGSIQNIFIILIIMCSYIVSSLFFALHDKKN